MRILVTGTEGQLARSLVERAAGHPDLELIAIGRPELDLEQEGSAASAIAQDGVAANLLGCATFQWCSE